MKDIWSIPLGWGDELTLSLDGKDIELFVGNPHRNYKAVYLTPDEARRLAKRLNKMAGE